MNTLAAVRKLKASFTLTPESMEFVRRMRVERNAGSDSETLDLLLHELIEQVRLQKLEAAVKDYYDSASEEELATETQWAEAGSASMWIGVPE